MKLSQLVLIAGLGTAALFSSASFAKPDHNLYRFLQSERAAAKLELTSSQQEQIAAIHTLSKAELDPLKEAMKGNRTAIKSIVQAEQFDEGAFRSAMQGNQSEMLEIAVIKARYNNQLWNVLTTEQQEKLSKMAKRKHKKMKKQQD